jgi:hypothetical protein
MSGSESGFSFLVPFLISSRSDNELGLLSLPEPSDAAARPTQQYTGLLIAASVLCK